MEPDFFETTFKAILETKFANMDNRFQKVKAHVDEKYTEYDADKRFQLYLLYFDALVSDDLRATTSHAGFTASQKRGCLGNGT